MEKTLRFLLYTTLFTPLIVAHGLFFPFIVGKMLALEGLVLLTVLLWLYLWSKNPARYSPSLTWLTLTMGIYVFVSFIAAFQGVNFWRSFWSNFERMDGIFIWIILLLFVIVAGGVFKSRRDWTWFFRVSLGVSILSGFRSVQFFHVLDGTFELPTRMAGEFGSPIYVGVYALFHVFIALILLSFLDLSFKRFGDALSFFRNRWGLFYILALLFNLLILFLSFARGPMIGFLAGIGVFILWYAFYGGSRRLLLKTGGAFLLLLLVTFPFWKDSSLAGRMYSISAGLQADETRIINWNVAIEAFKARPFLGWGSNNYTIAQNEFYDPHLLTLIDESFDRVHNKYLEIAVDGGVFSLLAYLAIFGVIGFRLFQERKKKPFLTALFAALFVAYLFQNITAFDNPGTYLPLMVMFAFVNYEFFQPLAFRPHPHPWLVISCQLLVVGFLWQGVWQPYQANRYLAKTLSLQERENSDYQSILDGYHHSLSYQTLGDYETRIRLGAFLARTDELTLELLDFGIRGLEEELTMSENDARVHIFLGRLYERRAAAEENKDPLLEKAKSHLVRAIELAPSQPQYYESYALFLMNKGESAKAREELRKIEALDEEVFKSHSVQWYIGASYYIEKDFPSAYDQFHHMLDEGKGFSSEQELLMLAQSSRELGKLDEMVTWYEKLVDTYKQNPQYRMVLANAYKEVGRREDALSEARNAATIDPSLDKEVEAFIATL